ncbi:MAG TPA: enoyl-CoA hydratase-related protein [Chloroflexota bacterium]|nr:enoyl-CoA hydratase-related protein [Chloroflexota bacterium]
MPDYPGSILRVEYPTDRPVAVLTLDAPPLNIVTIPTREHFAATFREIEHNDRVRVVIIRSAGEHFTSGGDIQGFLDATPEYLSHLADNAASPERCSKPVIARLIGYTFGVGLEIALACDLRIAADTTTLALPEMRLGMIPGSGGTQRVARLAGLGRAADMVLRARRIPAAEAQEWGLLTEVVPVADLDARVDAVVDELLAFSPLAQRCAKQALAATLETPLSTGLQLEGRMYGYLRTTKDFREGVRAFTEKRPARFEGR